MKIIIVGSGLTAHAAYHALSTRLASTGLTLSTIEIKLVSSQYTPSPSSRSPPSKAAPAQPTLTTWIAPNGLRALASINPAFVQTLQSTAFKGPKKTFCNSEGTELGEFWYGRGERCGYDTLGVPSTMLDSHPDFALPPHDQDLYDSEKEKKVVKVIPCASEEGVEVVYSDGTREVGDLVVGADGWNSVVRAGLSMAGVSSTPGCVPFQSTFDGVNTVGGLIPLSDVSPQLRKVLEDHADSEIMTFGRKGVFGFSFCTPAPSSTSSSNNATIDLEKGQSLSSDDGFLQWWSQVESPEPLPITPTPSQIQDIKTQLLERHADWLSPPPKPSPKPKSSSTSGLSEKTKTSPSSTGSKFKVYKELIELGCQDGRLAVSPRFHIPRLPHWTNLASSPSVSRGAGRIVLMGDAAHTTVHEIGQVAALGIEDALVYALVLQRCLAATPVNHGIVFEAAAKAYEGIRMERVGKVLDVDGGKECNVANMEFGWFAQLVRDWAFGWLCRAPEKMHDGMFMYNCEEAVEAYFKKDHC